ncbi:MAG: hypothetical protein ACRD2J_03215 [Thermoanaerobaculia bacterium]
MAATLALLALLLGGVAPEPATAWMVPEYLGLSLGMTPAAARAALEGEGLEAREGKEAGHLIVEIEARRTITLVFADDRLQSIRFELIGFLHEIPKAFHEIETALEERCGEPSRRAEDPPLLVFDARPPAVYVVGSTDRKTPFGKQGLGFLVVRYFDPPAER